jgi:ApaG protein
MASELVGFSAELERLEYVPSSSTPSHRPHQFAYYITIRNDSLLPLKITGRKWVLTNAENHKLIIEGDGVVGEFPELSPGESYHYHSYHLLDSATSAVGIYFAEDEDGNQVAARLPAFEMQVPSQG